MIHWPGKSILQTRQNLLVSVDVAHQEVKFLIQYDVVTITEPHFTFSLGFHLASSGIHFCRSWYNHWSPCIQSKSSDSPLLILSFFLFFSSFFVETKDLILGFI